MAILFNFLRNQLFSATAALFYVPTSNVRGPQFLHIFASICVFVFVLMKALIWTFEIQSFGTSSTPLSLTHVPSISRPCQHYLESGTPYFLSTSSMILSPLSLAWTPQSPPPRTQVSILSPTVSSLPWHPVGACELLHQSTSLPCAQHCRAPCSLRVKARILPFFPSSIWPLIYLSYIPRTHCRVWPVVRTQTQNRHVCMNDWLVVSLLQILLFFSGCLNPTYMLLCDFADLAPPTMSITSLLTPFLLGS